MKFISLSTVLVLLATATLDLGTSASPPFSIRRALPAPVSADTARTYLNQLTVAVDSNSPAYNRDLFPHWITVSGQCNTRHVVLQRDGTNVVVGTNCAATSGSWVSPYDNIPTNLASDLDIDHLIPLKEAWVSGARSWTTAQRQAFANDLTRPQLVAVTDTLNQAKDPAKWIPPLVSYRCTYVRAWIQVKNYYNLTIDSAEKTALTTYLAPC